MSTNKLNIEDKQEELKKYRLLVLATLDYYLEKKEIHFTTADFSSVDHYNRLKTVTEEYYKKGRLSKLKQYFRDLTEMQLETKDLWFNKYLQDKTKYDIDIFKSFYQRIDRIIDKGKITSDSQFYDINILLENLYQSETLDEKKIDVLVRLISKYEDKVTKPNRK